MSQPIQNRIEQRLIELGSPLPEVAKPVAAYVPSVVSGNLVFTSGQLPFKDGSLIATGKVGQTDGLVDPALAKTLARQCALNALAAIKLARTLRCLGIYSGRLGVPPVQCGRAGSLFVQTGRAPL